MGRTGTTCWLVATTILLENVYEIRFLICVHLRHLRTFSALRPGPQDHALTDIRHSPFTGELVAVVLEQAFGVDAVPLKRAATVVVDEQVHEPRPVQNRPCVLTRPGRRRRRTPARTAHRARRWPRRPRAS